MGGNEGLLHEWHFRGMKESCLTIGGIGGSIHTKLARGWQDKTNKTSSRAQEEEGGLQEREVEQTVHYIV